MLRTCFVMFCSLALCMGALAQVERSKSATYLEAQTELLRERQMQRRELLRETLKLQRTEVPYRVRQMTAQEKAELRQQLRQQPQDLVKKEDQ